MEKIHDLSFCPSCGSKLNGDETICPFCGYRLLEADKQFGIKEPEPPATTNQPPPSVAEPPAAPVIEEKPEPIVEPPAPPLPVAEKKHDLAFCPECGAKLDGNEVVCPICGFRLLEPADRHDEIPQEPIEEKAVEEIIAPPVIEPVIETIPEIPPIAPIAELPKEKVVERPPVIPAVSKKKKHTGLIIFLILLFLILAGAGTTAFLQYTGKINVPLLSFIPSNKPLAVVSNVEKNYYFCYAPNHTMKDQIIIISSVFMQSENGNSKVTATNAFKKLVNIQYPKDCFYFSHVIAMKYNNFEEAMKVRESTKQDYQKRQYKIRYIEIH
ncbi:MAG: zinc-ribbon domain-containing protein [Bacteroidota bacterium]